ncbi:MAG TPA: VOC family protein [Thermoplasmata archaeon]|nr:VOC family protein [Thermoplasmata archaeon]
MGDSWIGDFGIRVRDLERSLDFYTKLFDLEEIARGGDAEGRYVLLKDRRSGQRLELNWYAESSPFWAPYVPGEGLDHIEVRVRSVPEFLERWRPHGIVPVNRKLWVNASAVEKVRADPAERHLLGEETWTTRSGHRVAYILDPDGLHIALYDHPEEKWEGPIPDHY